MQDSTATVIGAMIVAPLMTPIIGTALAFVLTDRAMLTRSITLWVVGALLVVAIGFFFGWIDWAFTTEGNSQVASRVSPSLIDLVAALATGLVGAFALVRADVSDTLPGVAIAIALVPPLGVCGLVLQEGNYAEAFGALVLFSTNVSAIIFTGTLLLLLYRVRDVAQQKGRRLEKLTGGSLIVVSEWSWWSQSRSDSVPLEWSQSNRSPSPPHQSPSSRRKNKIGTSPRSAQKTRH